MNDTVDDSMPPKDDIRTPTERTHKEGAYYAADEQAFDSGVHGWQNGRERHGDEAAAPLDRQGRT